MRVIKFRVWDCELKEMIYDAQDESGYESDGFSDFLHQEIRYKVMQFTGLLDKSGKEIYEGDIILGSDGRKMAIGWADRFASFVLYSDGWMFEHYFGEAMEAKDGEIIGNICQNPELLNP